MNKEELDAAIERIVHRMAFEARLSIRGWRVQEFKKFLESELKSLLKQSQEKA